MSFELDFEVSVIKRNGVYSYRPFNGLVGGFFLDNVVAEHTSLDTVIDDFVGWMEQKGYWVFKDLTSPEAKGWHLSQTPAQAKQRLRDVVAHKIATQDYVVDVDVYNALVQRLVGDNYAQESFDIRPSQLRVLQEAARYLLIEPTLSSQQRLPSNHFNLYDFNTLSAHIEFEAQDYFSSTRSPHRHISEEERKLLFAVRNYLDHLEVTYRMG